jgi:Leucine-rich repeat (LRR) protein
MDSLSPRISNLTNLEYLSITGRWKFEYLSKEIGNLKKLRKLILEANGLKSIPKEIGNLENLNYLDLSACDLEALPPEIGNLKNLNRLKVCKNEGLKNIPVDR